MFALKFCPKFGPKFGTSGKKIFWYERTEWTKGTRCSGDGWGGGRKLLFLFLLQSFSTLSHIFSSTSIIGLGALLTRLLDRSFYPTSMSCIRDPMTGICASKVKIYLITSSSGFCLLTTFFAIGWCFCLKLASSSLSQVIYKSIASWICLANSVVVSK